jgi:hypothetical protein
LTIDIVLVLIASSGVALGATILAIIIKNPSLYKNIHLRLIMILLIFDFFLLLSSIPFALTLIIKFVPGGKNIFTLKNQLKRFICHLFQLKNYLLTLTIKIMCNSHVFDLQ